VGLRPIERLLGAFGWDAESVDGRDHAALERSLSRRGSAPAATVALIGEEAS
jgi:transketolase N-terminal domain/subunit